MTEPSTDAAILHAHDVHKTVRDGNRTTAILDGVDLDIEAGEQVALVGPSGAGKSTLLHILGALDPRFEGEVRVAGRSLAGLSDRELAALRNETLGFVFQGYNLLPHLSVLDNVLLPARFGCAAPDPERGRAVLELVAMRDKAHRRPDTLSGGERQRVAIARALYGRPRLILCDEPTGNLDPETGRDVLAVLASLAGSGRDGSAAVLIASHDPMVTAGADRVLELRGGALRTITRASHEGSA